MGTSPDLAAEDQSTRFAGKVPSTKARRVKRWLWGDKDLIDAEDEAWWRAEQDEPLLQYLGKKPGGYTIDVNPALGLAESVAESETERENNLNTRGTAVATVAAIVVPVATALANPLFMTEDRLWAGFPRNLAEYLFIGALVCITSAMVMAVVCVLRPGRGGRTKNAVGEAVVNRWIEGGGYITLVDVTDKNIASFQLDHLLRAIPAWHYRNRSKARWLRRAWMFLMLGVVLIGSVGVIFITELSQETIWEETAGAIAVSLIVIWLLIRYDVVRAGRPRKQDEGERKVAGEKLEDKAGQEAEESVKLPINSAMTAGLPNAGPGESRGN
jgi:hypothetical protein